VAGHSGAIDTPEPSQNQDQAMNTTQPPSTLAKNPCPRRLNWIFLAFVLNSLCRDLRSSNIIVPKEIIVCIIKCYRRNFWDRGTVDFNNLKCVLTFGKMGEGEGELRHPRGIAINSEGHIIVAEHDNARISVFDEHGQFIRHLKEKYVPLGITVDENDNILIADNYNGQITRIDPEGNLINRFGNAQGIREPWGITLNNNGEIFLTDNTHRIYRFSPRGDLIATFGQTGSTTGELMHPRGITVGPAGEVYVVDLDNRRVQIFDQDGIFLRGFGSSKIFDSPRDIAVDEAGNVFVGDSSHRYQIFDRYGKQLGVLGGSGSTKGKFANPMGIAFRHGRVYIADYDNHRVQVFASDA